MLPEVLVMPRKLQHQLRPAQDAKSSCVNAQDPKEFFGGVADSHIAKSPQLTKTARSAKSPDTHKESLYFNHQGVFSDEQNTKQGYA